MVGKTMMGISDEIEIRKKSCLELSRLYHQHDALGGFINALGVVFLGQAGSVSPCECLPKTCADRAEECLDEIV